MGIPQIIYIVLLALNVGMDMVNHGKPKQGKVNVGMTVVGAAINIGILIWGGFFK